VTQEALEVHPHARHGRPAQRPLRREPWRDGALSRRLTPHSDLSQDRKPERRSARRATAGGDGITASKPGSQSVEEPTQHRARPQWRRRSLTAVQRRRDKASPLRPIANKAPNPDLEATVLPSARYREARSAILKRPLGPRTLNNLAGLLVPRGGIEPPTRGFSAQHSAAESGFYRRLTASKSPVQCECD